MKAHDRIPTDALGGGCLINKRARLFDGEKIIDTGIDYDQLPVMSGRLCISEGGLLELMSVLGWQRRTPRDEGLIGVNQELRSEIVELRAALRNVLAAAELVDVDVPVDADLDLSAPAKSDV